MADTRSLLDIQKFIHARENGKLSTRHRALVNSVIFTPEEQAATLSSELSDSNLAMLQDALTSTKDQSIRDILEEEKAKIMMLRDSPKATASPPIDTTTLLDKIGSVISNLWSTK